MTGYTGSLIEKLDAASDAIIGSAEAVRYVRLDDAIAIVRQHATQPDPIRDMILSIAAGQQNKAIGQQNKAIADWLRKVPVEVVAKAIAKVAYDAARLSGVHAKPDHRITCGDDWIDCDAIAQAVIAALIALAEGDAHG